MLIFSFILAIYCCFVYNIGAAVEKNTPLVDLQRRILRRLVNYNEEISSVDEGKALMRDRIRGVRVLVILDGVNDGSQLDAVNGDWFGHGSRIIITSRDQHILNLAKVDSVHKMSGLQQHESRQLFSWHAFSRPFSDTPYEELSTRISQACCGNPLLLEVIGSHLFDKKEPNEIQCWEETLLNIGEDPKMSRFLRISYDGLDDIEKEIFLDVACNFAGEKKRHAVIFWEVLYPNKVQTAIKNLLLKMLINISGPQELLHMHDLLQEMGRGIQKEADNNSRLWLPMSTHNALNRDRAERVKKLVYTGYNESEPVVPHSMPSLRYLFLQNTKVLSNIGNLAPNLIWIRIRNCEFLSDIYTWLILRNRLQFDGSWSQIRMFSLELCASLTRTPKTVNNSVNLQSLNLEDCLTLTTIPNSVGNFSQLKQFNLGGCASLTSLPDTVGNLKQLKDLSLGGCTGLKSLPSTVGSLAQLQVLNLYGCRGLRVLPNSVGELEKLQVLNLHGCEGLQNLPSKVGNLAKLRMFKFSWCSGFGSLQHMESQVS
ncbi:disease resistance protein Roq1 [Cryptomeria japonica]|uniref:disease resistance protein Roq1 n=1 Tax=Cryptomeria japonica TaxID=3369 RepID=UPI0027DA7486|nr:disease resistance protein Roq1 [Cryptomeria japonica]